jgi:hypothetical protein
VPPTYPDFFEEDDVREEAKISRKGFLGLGAGRRESGAVSAGRRLGLRRPGPWAHAGPTASGRLPLGDQVRASVGRSGRHGTRRWAGGQDRAGSTPPTVDAALPGRAIAPKAT